MFAYPMMEQVRSAIGMYEKSRSRAMDIGSVRGHLLRVLSKMAEQIHDPPKGGVNEIPVPATVFILAGYSWLTNQFRTWMLRYDKTNEQFGFASPPTLFGNQLCLAGDHVKDAKERIIQLLNKRKKRKGSGFDMEPFEVLRDMCRDESLPEIGGAPQVLKIYRHMNTMPYAVYWPTRASKKVTFMGRPLLEYEMASYLVLDPDSLETFAFEPAISKAGKLSRSVEIRVEGVSAAAAVGDAAFRSGRRKTETLEAKAEEELCSVVRPATAES